MTRIALVVLFVLSFVWLRYGPPLYLGAPASATLRVPHDAPSVTPTQISAVIASAHAGSLIVPVAGVTRAQLSDTWGQARSEGRTHEGIDILAPQGTPVFAAADGRIVKFFDSVRGGVTIYEFDQSERFIYYYAHLSARAAGLVEGDRVRQGQLIAYVGMTGNAPVPHLHFEIERLTPAKHWWEAEAMNPFPYLRTGQAPS